MSWKSHHVRGYFYILAKAQNYQFLHFFFNPPFFLHSWTGISSFSTKFLILQDIFNMHIGMHNYNKVLFYPIHKKDKKLRGVPPKHLHSVFSTSILL